MRELRLAVLPLRILLVTFFLGLLVAQVVSMPGQFRYMAQEEPDLAYLRWPLTVWSILLLACVQMVIVCTWKLLDMVQADRIFSDQSFRWVDVIIATMVVAWLLFAGMTSYLAYLASDPGAAVLPFGISLCGAVFLMLLVVMRALLRQATTLRTDMEAVI